MGSFRYLADPGKGINGVRLIAATLGIAILQSLLYGFTGFAGAFLDSSDHFVFFALGELEVVVGELRPFLDHFSFDDVPVAFEL